LTSLTSGPAGRRLPHRGIEAFVDRVGDGLDNGAQGLVCDHANDPGIQLSVAIIEVHAVPAADRSGAFDVDASVCFVSREVDVLERLPAIGD
jgi:hypothetical protein